MEEQQAPECYQGAVVEFKSQMTVVTAMWTIYDQINDHLFMYLPFR